MSEIHEYISVHCPFDLAPKYLREFFESAGAKGGVGATLEVRAPLGDVKLEREVIASIHPLSGFPGYERLGIGWEPSGGGPYPKFEGILTVSEESIDYTRLDLDGSYRPPFNIAGAVFDAALGNRIAQATARELLTRLRDVI